MGATMRQAIRVLTIPLAITLLIEVSHFLLEDSEQTVQLVDIIATVAIVATIFYLGWRVSAVYVDHWLRYSALLGCILWLVSSTFAISGRQLKYWLSGLVNDQWSVEGAIVAAFLFVPIASIFAIAGSLAGSKLRGLRRHCQSDS
jgi:threonine/homoserine/homoserine lactone efflux protein